MATKIKKKIDRAAIEAAKEMVRLPNTDWDLPSRRDEVLAVARTCLQAAELAKLEQKKLREARKLLKKAASWLETANDIIQESVDGDESDDEDAKAFIVELRKAAA